MPEHNNEEHQKNLPVFSRRVRNTDDGYNEQFILRGDFLTKAIAMASFGWQFFREFIHKPSDTVEADMRSDRDKLGRIEERMAAEKKTKEESDSWINRRFEDFEHRLTRVEDKVQSK